MATKVTPKAPAAKDPHKASAKKAAAKKNVEIRDLKKATKKTVKKHN